MMFSDETATGRGGNGNEQFGLEALEPRVLLTAVDSLPLISDLEDADNAVVRLTTNFGNIDLEMFGSDAPLSVANFLSYVRDGDYGESFFHRLEAGMGTNNVLQGGGYRLSDDDGLSFIPAEDPVTLEAVRNNLERTVGLARTSDPNSATSQFYINLADNPGFDAGPGSDGFAVFGRVVNNASWSVVQAIAGLRTFNFPPPSGFPAAFGDLPVTDDYDGMSALTSADTVQLIDAEIIKPANVNSFYTQRIFYAEGFASDTINEFLPMYNPGGSTVHYQVVVRSEVAQTNPNDGMTDFWYRDKVISEGSIGAGARGGITVSTVYDAMNNLVDKDVPYSIEVWSTGEIAANLSHFDFGSATGEAFTDQASDTWAVADMRKDNGRRNEFLLWHNPNSTAVTMNATFYFNGQAAFTRTFVAEPLRRGGLNIANTPFIPDDTNFSVLIEADSDIIVAHTQFDNAGLKSGSTSLAVPGAGSNVGELPIGIVDSENNIQVSFVNPNNVGAVITLTVVYDDDGRSSLTATPAQLIIPANSRKSFDLSSLAGLAQGEFFSLRYSSGSTDVYAHARHTSVFSGLPGGEEAADVFAQPFAVQASTERYFSEGFMDPTRAGVDVFEHLSIRYAPLPMGSGVDANVDVKFQFADGSSVMQSFVMPEGDTQELTLHELAPLLNQISMTGRRFYSIQVTSDQPVVVGMIHIDLTLGDDSFSGGFGTIGLEGGTSVALGS